jgi:hypothetical protein
LKNVVVPSGLPLGVWSWLPTATPYGIPYGRLALGASSSCIAASALCHSTSYVSPFSVTSPTCATYTMLRSACCAAIQAVCSLKKCADSAVAT